MARPLFFVVACGATVLFAAACAPSATMPKAAAQGTPRPSVEDAPASRGLVLADAVPANAVTEARDPAEPGVVPPLAPAPVNVETSSQRESRRLRRALGWTLLGFGAEGLIVAVPTSIILLDKKHRLDQSCDAQKECGQTGVNEANSFTALTPINTVSWITAVVGAAAGATLLLTAPSEHARTAVVAVGPGSVGLSGTF